LTAKALSSTQLHNPPIAATGNDNRVQSAYLSTIIPSPITGNISFHDLIVVPEHGDKPFYVMLSNPAELARIVVANSLAADQRKIRK
jgi:hypothetical protein